MKVKLDKQAAEAARHMEAETRRLGCFKNRNEIASMAVRLWAAVATGRATVTYGPELQMIGEAEGVLPVEGPPDDSPVH